MARRSFSGAIILPALLTALAAAAAGCAPTTPPPAAIAATDAPAARTVAFEPITGLPDDRGTVFATELGGSAVETGLNIVSRDDEQVDFRLKGYLTAESRGTETVLTHVWDIFDADGTRVHRIEDEVRLPAALPDPWQAITDDALQQVARDTVEALAAWLGSGAPVTVGRAGPAAAATAFASAGEIGAAATQRMSAARAPASPDATSFHLAGITGMAGGEAAALAAAMQAELVGIGLTPARSAADADLVLGGEATIGPETGTGRTVALIWSVEETSSGRLGSIRQVRELAAGALETRWPTEARHAAIAASSGLVALLTEDR